MISNATSIRCNRDSDSILEAVATSYDFCNSIGTSATWRGVRTRSALSLEAAMRVGLMPGKWHGWRAKPMQRLD
jgi:hypothetical protein